MGVHDEFLEEWVQLYNDGDSVIQIADKYSVHKSSVYSLFSKNAVSTRKKTYHHINKNEFVKLYQNGFSMREISSRYGCSENTVKSYLESQGCKRRERGDSNRKYPLNEQYFDKLDSDEKCYWLGFIAADGCIMHYTMGKRSLYQMTLTQHVRDIEHLERFKKAIGSNQKLRMSKGTSTMRLTLNSKRLFESLNNIGIFERKANILEFPKTVPKEYYYSFIRGVLDGDGHAHTRKRLDKNTTAYHLGITGTKVLLDRIAEIIFDELGIKNPKTSKGSSTYRSKGFTYNLTYCSLKNIIKIRDWLYRDSDLYLKRKKDTLDTFEL